MTQPDADGPRPARPGDVQPGDENPGVSGGFDPAAAAAILDLESTRVRRAFDVRLTDQLAAWAVAWFVGLGLVWWQVSGQHPYAGPGTGVLVTLSVLMALAVLVTVHRIHRATAGIGGESARRGRIIGAVWGGGVVAGFLLVGAAAANGAEPRLIGVLVVCLQLLICGVLYVCSSALFGNRVLLLLGGWLILLGAVAGFAGPVAVAAIGAVGGGGGFLAAALAHRRPPERQ